MPMLPPAPGRFSITTGWPHFSDSFWPTMRASASEAPPGVCGTMMRTGLAGKVWARAAGALPKTVASASRAVPAADLMNMSVS